MKEDVIAGFVLSCVGDNRDYSIVHSKYANTLADKALENVLKFHTGNNYSEYSFLERGSDERQYNSVGVGLPVVGFCRSKYGEYPEYHTSADDLSLVSPEGLQGSYDVMKQVIDVLEFNAKYVMDICCEPQLGKRGLYPTVSQKGSYDKVRVMMDLIAYADGTNDIIDISNIIHAPIDQLIDAVIKLRENNLIKELGE